MMRFTWIVLLLLVAAPAQTIASAGPISKEQAPEPLRPWVDWVLYGHEDAGCPFFQGAQDRRQCVWPSRLSLNLGDRGGSFTQAWLVYRDAWVPLPGDGKVWPQQVRVDGRPAVIAPQNGVPSLRLQKGRHTVAGAFEWDALPPLLQIPTETGLLSLTLRGRGVVFPGRDGQGRLWLQRSTGEEEGESRLEVTVYRTVTDEIPLQLATHVELQVSGKSREVLLGRALPDGFVPMSLSSLIPVRLEPDGHLRVQARTGRWSLVLIARHEGPVASLGPPAPQGPWDSEEVWVFAARPHLRLVSVEGVQAVDPQQTTLPEDLKHLPTYLLQPGQTMQLVEKRRGDADPAPDQLHMQRVLWLDFDGRGYTVRDQLTGTMERGWRLEMQPPAVLGRVAIDGRDQFITRLSGEAPAGVEIRQGRVQIEAESRVPAAAASIPAVGWNQDFRSVSGDLLLGPGWRLFHASGVDDASFTWISSWNLLDMFLVLILALAVTRLWGWRWGALALLTLGLTWIEPGAPRWVWVAVLSGEALWRAFPEGRARRAIRALHLLALVALAVVSVPFLVQQVRAAIYPALEQPWAYGRPTAAGKAVDEISLNAPQEEGVYREEDKAQVEGGAVGGVEEGVVGGVRGGLPGGVSAEARPGSSMAKIMSAPPPPSARRKMDLYVNAPDPRAVVQTGPGLPEWDWKHVSLRWRGPVESAQRLRLYLVSPSVNFILAFARVVLLAILGLCVFGFAAGSWPGALLRRLGGARALSVGLFVCVLAGASSTPARAEIPSTELLNALRDRLLAQPECYPDCASVPRLALEASPGSLRARLEVHAAASTAVPLPGAAEQWLPERVFLDGEPAAGMARTADGRLWLQISPGSHQVLMEGSLPEREVVQIPLPLRPHRVTASAQGWRVEGLSEDGQAEGSLQLVRIRAREQGAARGLEAGPLPPFVRVERTLSLGLDWQVDTRVIRMTPSGVAVLLEVPLLEGESVTTPEVRVKAGKARVSLGPQADRVEWSSTLEQRPRIRLEAPTAVPWTEVWQLAVGQIWHAEVEGIPVIHRPGQEEVRMREWRPWPGESVTVSVSRPEGLPGQTLTVDRTVLTLSPGLRATDATLLLVLRSSRGGQHALTLPEGAVLQSVSINSAEQPIRQDGRQVTLPVAPGRQEVALSWRQSRGITAALRAPELRIGLQSVNAQVKLAMPADRCILLVGGPRLGPAVLFWSLLFVSLLVSLGLGQLRLTPLRWQHWFLLSLGLTQAPLWVPVLIVIWFLALGWRRERGPAAGKGAFDSLQVLLAGATLFALWGLFASIRQGLLGLPEMQIAGNGSTSLLLQWYQDRAGETLPRPWVLSVPLIVYRLAMLAWALWLAQALLGWLRWGWGCFSEGGLWRPLRAAKPPVPPPGPAGATAA